MKVKAKINLIDATMSGISQSSGNKWVSKDVVLQVLDEGYEYASTLACRARQEAVINALEHCQQGDVIEAEISTWSKVRGYGDKSYRSNEATILSFTILEPKGF